MREASALSRSPGALQARRRRRLDRQGPWLSIGAALREPRPLKWRSAMKKTLGRLAVVGLMTVACFVDADRGGAGIAHAEEASEPAPRRGDFHGRYGWDATGSLVGLGNFVANGVIVFNRDGTLTATESGSLEGEYSRTPSRAHGRSTRAARARSPRSTRPEASASSTGCSRPRGSGGRRSAGTRGTSRCSGWNDSSPAPARSAQRARGPASARLCRRRGLVPLERLDPLEERAPPDRIGHVHEGR